jgi:DNA polymerase III subunit beta
MKIIIERSKLNAALMHVHRVVEKKNTAPILSNVLIRAENDKLLLKATDIDIEVTTQVDAEVINDGVTTIPAHMAFEIVRKLPNGSHISLETNDEKGTLTIKAGRSRFSLQTISEVDFPDLSQGEMTHSFELPAKEFRRLFDKTQFAISSEETRYYLNGIYLHTVNVDGIDMLRCVATDGHRLAQSQIQAPKGSIGMTGIIIPRKTVAEILRLTDSLDSGLNIKLSTQKICFSVGDTTVTSKLIDGTFPDYTRVIPVNNNRIMIVEKSDLISAVDRVATVASQRGRAVKLSLSDRKLLLTVVNPDSGTATEEIEAYYDSGDLEIGFNARYLLDIAAKIDGDTVELQFNDSGYPVLCKDTAKDNEIYVLMPMRVQDMAS